MATTRREAILSALFGAGAIGLRALATGLPLSMLGGARQALAFDGEGACADQQRAQFLILSTSAAGDPLNANVPGTYDFPDIYHSADPAMAKTPLTISGQAYTAAAPWAALPQAVLDRTCFFHHTTKTNNHGNQPKVMALMGGVKRQEMLVSLLSRQLAPCLGTVQADPALVSGNFITAKGRVMPPLSPTSLRDVLTSANTPLLKALQDARDRNLDQLNALYKKHGNGAQRAALDRMATSQTQLRALSQDLLDRLSGIKSNGPDGQIVAAAALLAMKVSPVVVVSIPFGGDNHGDTGLKGETAAHVSGVGYIAQMLQLLGAFGLGDKATFVAMNVFGRTLFANASGGRDHMANHHCTVMIGKPIRGSVIGGLEPMKSGGYAAQAIDSRTGKGGPSGDIAFAGTLGAVGKTLGAAAGVAPSVLDDQITDGKIVKAALAT